MDNFYLINPLHIKKHQPNQAAKHQNIHFWVRGEKPFDAMFDHKVQGLMKWVESDEKNIE
jgi:hypothetical protein